MLLRELSPSWLKGDTLTVIARKCRYLTELVLAQLNDYSPTLIKRPDSLEAVST